MKGNLFGLLHLFDSALPIGAYAHSGGLETYTQEGVVRDKATAERFVRQFLTRNFLFGEAGFFCFAYRFAREQNVEELVRLDVLASASKSARETREASQKLGARLVRISESWSSSPEVLPLFREQIRKGECQGNSSVVFGILAFELGIPLEEAVRAFFYNAAAGLVTNCSKLVPLGQQDAQAVLFEVKALLEQLSEQAVSLEYADLGRCAIGFEIRAMQHEKLYSRLYMS